MDSVADTSQNRLIAELRQLIEFLRSQNQDQWESWFLDALRRVENGDQRGLIRIKTAYGGMGSFSDLMLMDESANKTLQLLRTNIWSSVEELQRLLK